MCCAGCQAVAQAIVDGGLADYYRHRDELPESPRLAVPEAIEELGLFDHADYQASFVRPVGEGEREASLILEGISCAACVWLNESHLARQPGVTAVAINYATRRAMVRWDPARTGLSALLAAVAAIGYRAHPYDVARSEAIARSERRAALWRLFVAGFGSMQVMMYAIPAYIATDGSMSADIDELLRWASLILTLPVVAYSAAPFFSASWRDLRLRRVGMDLPVALGVGLAFAASVYAMLLGRGAVYFDSVTMFVFFLLGGRYLEMMARQTAVRGVEELARLTPAFALRLSRWPARELERVAVVGLGVGDHVLVKAGEVIPADGVVIEGRSLIDEALLTGESQALARCEGDAVVGGSINRGSPLVLRIERVGEQTRLSQIRRLMERAATDRPRVVQLADRVAGWFVAVLLVVALVTFAYWLWADSAMALPIVVSVLVVSCPCALSLATPTALTVASGGLARLGMLATRGQAIEALARANRFVFDKTGTLTVGQLRLVQTHVAGGISAAQALRDAAAIERGSEHAVAAAILQAHAGMDGLAPVTDAQTIAGQGVAATLGERQLRIGRVEFVQSLHGRAIPPSWVAVLEKGDSCAVMGDDTGWIALFRFADVLRPNAAVAVSALKAAGCGVSILSGDIQSAVDRVGCELAVDLALGGLTPEQKCEAVVALQASGELVAMVGDGINDAPVLAQAQVSVAMGGGTELARTQADFVMLRDDLLPLAASVQLARKTLVVVRQNLAWAVAYNAAALPLAMTGHVTPWMAGIGMSASSLMVVLNALRLRPDVARRT